VGTDEVNARLGAAIQPHEGETAIQTAKRHAINHVFIIVNASDRTRRHRRDLARRGQRASERDNARHVDGVRDAPFQDVTVGTSAVDSQQ